MTPTTMRILIVDDEEPVADLLASFCGGPGREVSVCTSSLEALSRIAADPPDVLVTDIVMARLDGLSLVREARQIDAHLEAIVVTGYAVDYPMEAVLESGASDLILKPIRMKEFRARVDLAIERRRATIARTTRQHDLQVMSIEMIDGLQRELEEATKKAAPAPKKLAS
jgi:DNA-binding response OmpR family regulator